MELEFDEETYQHKTKTPKDLTKDIKCQLSLYLFRKDKCFRKAIIRIAKSNAFDYFILIIIILNSAKLCYDTYLMDYSNDNIQVKVSRILDFIFNGIFITEMVLKIIAYGFMFDPGSYIRDIWNIIDFLQLLFPAL